MDRENKESCPQLELKGYRVWLTCGNEYTYINTNRHKHLLGLSGNWLAIWVNNIILVDYHIENIERVEYLYEGINYPIDTLIDTDQIVKDIKEKL